MSFAYLPLYTGDYLRDTRHLSCCEHGVYVLLLVHCWDQQGPLPLDEKKIAGICGARSGDEIEAMRRVLQEFFTLLEDGWYNRRMQHEVERANAISLKRKSAGSKGFQAKAKHLPGKRLASASTLTLTPIPSPASEDQTLKALSGKPDPIPLNGRDYKAESREVLDYLNRATGRGYRAVDSNLKPIMARLKSGLTPTRVKEVVLHKCDQWKGDAKMDQYLRPDTLFNATKFEQYLGEISDSTAS